MTDSLPHAAPPRPRRWPWLVAIVGLGVALDQASKLWAEHTVRGRGVLQVIEGLFDLRYARNRGAFFSMGAGLPELWRRGLLVTFAVVASLWMLKLYRDSPPEQRRLRTALALLISGAIGNLIDRVRQGEVTDFLHLHFGELFHWATFNAADIYIAAGLCLLIPELFISPPDAAHPAAPPNAP